MSRLRSLLLSRHAAPVAILVALSLACWGKVLFTGNVLLPGAMLQGFAPFGASPNADWNILQWDALGQYFPWRAFAARELQAGHIPLWNPHQFSGAPFVANGQSAVFYPLNIVFWIFDPAYAFGLSALLHTLLAALSTYFLAQHWKLSRAASLLAAIAFAFCGYLASWVMLPTLSNSASWLPLLLLLFERAVPDAQSTPDANAQSTPQRFQFPLALGVVLCCALLAGHAQIFFYLLVALGLRALFLPNLPRALSTLAAAFALSLGLGALQLFPTLELARLGHRAGASATMTGWNFLQTRALQLFELPSLFIPAWPRSSFSENFGYVGVGVLLLSAVAVVFLFIHKPKLRSPYWFAAILAVFGVLYAAATPLSQAFYFGVPGLAQMGGVGRALLLWSFGAAMLAAFGLDALRRRWSTPVIPAVALLLIAGELFFNSGDANRVAPRASVYPPTQLTTWLQQHTQDGARVLFITPRESWLPSEAFNASSGRTHPAGVLPPNGATVYGLNDVSGYDSLAPRAYREFVAPGENLKAGEDISPALNGNMLLLQNPNSPALEQLGLRYVVSQSPLDATGWKEVLRANGCIVYERAKRAEQPNLKPTVKGGEDFNPGWRDGKYQPESFRFGSFISLCALAFCAFCAVLRLIKIR
jgi:hypothetical protein